MNYNVDELFDFKQTDGGYALDYYRKTDDPTITELEIPAEYNGVPVVKISYISLGHSNYIKHVKIPGSVKEIGGSAFSCCRELEEIEFSEGLELIGTAAFEQTALKRVKIPGSVKDISGLAFGRCLSLEEVEFSKGLKIIGSSAFEQTGLKSVKLPKSVKEIHRDAFKLCKELERVEFVGSPRLDINVFKGCPKLPPETLVMGLVRSTDIMRPIFKSDISVITANDPDVPCDCFRRDVFELLVKNDCFRNCNMKHVFMEMITHNKPELFPLAEQYGMFPSAKIIDKLISYSAERKNTECTAYLLDLKNRKYGFGNFETEETASKYSADGLYRFEINSDKSIGGYMLARYLKNNDPTVTELEIPEEFNGKPVTMICSGFFHAKFLRRVVIPPSVRYISSGAFSGSALESVKLPNAPIKIMGFAFSECKNLERVEFADDIKPELGPRVFHGCEKLPPELLAMSMTRSLGELRRVCRMDYRATLENIQIIECDSLRADVFEILAKNKCFKKLNLKFLFEKLINENRHDLFSIAEQYGMLDSAALLDLLISCAIEKQRTELTAYLLDLKNRKFGFNDFEGDGKFEL